MALRYPKYVDLWKDGKFQPKRLFQLIKDLDKRLEELEE